MGLAPLVRSAGSTLTLRYRGLVENSGSVAASYPIDPATYPSDSAFLDGNNTFLAWVRLPLFDAWSDVVTLATQIPVSVYDDGQFAGEAPHRTVACVASATPGINTTDLSINTKTWAQNIDIVSRQIDANVVLADTGVSQDNDPANGAMILLDQGASSGLGGPATTGLPVIAIAFTVLTTGGQEEPVRQNFSIDVTITIRHSVIR